MMKQTGYKRQRPAAYSNRDNRQGYPPKPQMPAQGSYLARTSAYPVYKYISPIAKKLTPGPNVKKTEYHANIVYPQIYATTPMSLGPDPVAADIPGVSRQTSLYPHLLPDARPQCLTLCSQGNSSTDRVGNAVDAKGIQLYVQICQAFFARVIPPVAEERVYRPDEISAALPPEVVGDQMRNNQLQHPSNVRIVIMMDKDFTGGKPPTLRDVFATGVNAVCTPGAAQTETYNTTCQMKPDATQRYLVLMNKMVSMDGLTQYRTIKKNIKLDGVEIRYNQNNAAALPANCAQNTIWMWVLADVVAFDPNSLDKLNQVCPTYSFTSRFRFMPK